MAPTSRRPTYPGYHLIRRDLAEVERILHRESRSEVRLVMQVADHILDSGGKRFRPSLLLLCARLCGYRGKKAAEYGAALEYAHTSTLLHDDVVDEGRTRRGRASANAVFGNQTSVLVGDYLLFKSFHLLLKNKNPAILRLVNQVAIQMAEGEAFQLTKKQNPALREADYFTIITGKTAALIAVSCRIGALLGQAPAKKEKALGRFGLHLGLAFQLADDALDYADSAAGWGKTVGQDFGEGKMTLPLIRAYAHANPAEKKQIARWMHQPHRNEADFQAALQLIRRYDGLASTHAEARRHIALAKKQLELFPPSPARRALAELADFVEARTV